MRNDYEIRGNVVAIILKQKNGNTMETIIDLEDFDKVEALNLSWHAQWDNVLKKYYCKATRYLGYIDKKGKCETVYLHAVVLGFHKKMHIDHINHDTLDNRKSNLVEKTARQNVLNRKGANSNNKSGHRNVSWSKIFNKWIIQLEINGKNHIFDENFDSVENAANFAEQMRSKYYGDCHGNG